MNVVNFNGAGGEWTFLDDFSASHIILNAGNLNTNNKAVKLTNNFDSQSANGLRTISLGSSTVEVSDWDLYSGGLSFNAGTSSITVNGSEFNGGGFTYYNVSILPPGSNGHISVYGGSHSFNDLTLGASATLNGDNSMNNLVLFPGGLYSLEKGKTQTIVSSLTLSGSCSDLATLQSTIAGVAAFLKKNSGEVVVDFVNLKDIHASGGASFIATNAIDLGNNSGWTMSTPEGRNFYWIGGTGKWSEPAHWSTSSGGIAAGCLPTQFDNVFFDTNSFTAASQSVNIDVVSPSTIWIGVVLLTRPGLTVF